MTLLFLYLSGRLVGRGVEKSIRSVSSLATTTVDRSADVFSDGINAASGIVRDSASALGKVMGEFVVTRNSQTIHAAILEARSSFEVTTCKMHSVVYHKLERKSWSTQKVLVEVMPVEISYGIDLHTFTEKDISVSEDGKVVEITLPALRVTSLQKGQPYTVFTNMKNVSLEEMRECQEALDQRMRELAKSVKSLSIGEELSRNSFREMTRFLFLLIEEEHRPSRIEIKLRPREHYRLELPKPLELESHHLPGPIDQPRESKEEEHEEQP